jgi:hypothetical protein
LPAPETKVALPKPQAETAEVAAPQVAESKQDKVEAPVVEQKPVETAAVESVATEVKSDDDFNFATDAIGDIPAVAVQEPAPVAQPEATERRTRRRRKPLDPGENLRFSRIPPEIEAEEMNRPPVFLRDEMEQATSTVAVEAFTQAVPTEHVNVESRISNVKREPTARRPKAQEPAQETLTETTVETPVEVVTVTTATADVAEVKQDEAVVTTAEVAVEETVETVTEVADTTAPVEQVVTETAAEPQAEVSEDALTRLTAGLTEALAEKGLEVVHTRAELVEPLEYKPVIYPGRPRKELPPLDDKPLIQVHTTKLD